MQNNAKYLNADLTPMFPKEAEEESALCEKCGEEAGTRTAGDESVIYCRNCNWTTL